MESPSPLLLLLLPYGFFPDLPSLSKEEGGGEGGFPLFLFFPFLTRDTGSDDASTTKKIRRTSTKSLSIIYTHHLTQLTNT